MDKFAILRKVQQAVSSLPDTAQTTFAIATLYVLEQRLQNDIKAEAEPASVTPVRNGDWDAAAKRRKITCKRLRDERDAAREYITRMDQERKDLISERDALQIAHRNLVRTHEALRDEHQNLIPEYNARVSEREHLRDECDKLRDECNALQAAYSASQAERDKLQIDLDDALQAEPCPVSDRLAALEDHVELMGAQFAAYCKTVNEQFCDASDSITHGFQIVHKRLDKLKSV